MYTVEQDSITITKMFSETGQRERPNTNKSEINKDDYTNTQGLHLSR